MGSDYKRIILLKGLEAINEYQFSIVKSLLARDLGLTANMQEEYNKVQIADLMERKFPGPACVDKLVKLFKDIEGLGDVVKILKNEKKKVMRQSGARGKEPMKKRRQDSPRTDESTSTVNEASGSVHDTVMSKKKKIKTTQQDESMRTQPTQEQSPRPGPSATSTQSTSSYPQTPQMPPPTPGSSSATKKKKMETTQNDGPMRTPPTQGQSPLPGPSATSTQSTCSYSQTLQMPAPTPGSSSTTKKKKMETTQNNESMRTPPTQGQSPLPGPSAMSTQSTCSYPQTLQMPAPTPGSSSTTKKPRLKVVPTEASIEEGFQKGPKEVMVLKATEPFSYDPMKAEKKMFHATVATESQFFQVKVFHVSLKNKFIPKNIIAISDYHGRNGFLELYGTSRVSDVNSDQKMEISSRLIQNAKATPKINTLYSQKPGTFVSGIYQVHKKNVLSENIILYEIQDNTGKIEVLVYGRLTNVNCEEGDKLRLICFELSMDPRQLRSVIHSFIKVIKPRKNKKQLLGPDSHTEISL
ncbi:gamma-interferon-inducible protein 16-like isoform X1 [Mustela nigripes]|uniref:gamma-interferon-inducible protein 16-like isoform X1 n=2 Tax=Mustela nigripes TaxID=77151 RepID=UPI002814BABA|nr:gamma-interferon-inducible protein 16-like isoform X1 [Mustela nigripes]